ncbi:hypothetical protein ACFQ4Q_22840 [Lysobacter gummosus]|uniref:hypothetical protein n=1 Tax=Lysobacter gummosus TaxID=262324 RepID=UPI0036298F56
MRIGAAGLRRMSHSIGALWVNDREPGRIGKTATRVRIGRIAPAPFRNDLRGDSRGFGRGRAKRHRRG